MLNLHRLRLLVELERRGRISDVAQALSYSASSVSQQLKLLESEAGVPLLEPVGRGVRLTSAGQGLAQHARQILAQVDRAEADLAASRSEVAGDVRVGIFQTATITLIPAVLELLSVRHPALTLYVTEIQPDAGTASLLAREFDLVLGEEYPGMAHPPPNEITRTELFRDPLRIYIPEARERSTERRLSSLADADWIFEPTGKPARAWAEAVCRTAGFEPRVRFESADLLVHVHLVETGHAIALLPDLVWGSRTPTGRLLPLPGQQRRQVYSAVRAGAEARPALIAIRDAFSDIADQRGLSPLDRGA
ncbi:LysR substrate-binding domain-containing protein [Kribbella sp. NPDC050124]|uniref:LysR substrate-binding domain-containing protein n=1 Tax=Kribbella sp. NPDC050124 TaxID=3364114 RepID=UPI0037881685